MNLRRFCHKLIDQMVYFIAWKASHVLRSRAFYRSHDFMAFNVWFYLIWLVIGSIAHIFRLLDNLDVIMRKKIDLVHRII